MRVTLALILGRILRFAVRLVRPGGGSALPGLVVSKLIPDLAARAIGSLPKGLVIVTGTAGKSTTTKMLVALVRAHGVTVFTNPSTANIEQGFLSTIIKTGNVRGQIPGEIAIMEMDEGHAASFVKQVQPRYSIILNVFDDQLDRFIDPALVRDKLLLVAKATKEKVFLNGDDQNCLIIDQDLNTPTSYFGIDHSVGTLDYAETYLPRLDSPVKQSEVISHSGRKVTISSGIANCSFDLPNRGLHFALDAVAAIAAAQSILGESFDVALANKTMDELPPVFSRGEIKIVDGEEVEFILVQNPISMQLNLDNLDGNPEQIFFAIGRDVHDPSWMWTVDYSNLSHATIVSGFNYADAALVLRYNAIPVETVEPDYFNAIDTFFNLPKPKSGRKTVIYSADAMRRLRRYKGFTDPEDVKRV